MFDYLQRLLKSTTEISALSEMKGNIQKKLQLKLTESQHLEKLTSLAVIETNIALLEINEYSEDEIYETLDSKLPYAANIAFKKTKKLPPLQINKTILSIREKQYEL